MLMSAWLKGKSIVTYAVSEHYQLFVEALLRGAVVTNQFETNSPEYTQRNVLSFEDWLRVLKVLRLTVNTEVAEFNSIPELTVSDSPDILKSEELFEFFTKTGNVLSFEDWLRVLKLLRLTVNTEVAEFNNKKFNLLKDICSIRELELDPFRMEYVIGIVQQDSGSLDCGVFVAAYVEYLGEGLGIPSLGIDAQYRRMIYATLLCKHDSVNAEKGYFSENDDPPRPRSSFTPKEKVCALHIE
ncbi:hypothetical protein CQW23_16773 [Capsicum baccatum]|uniref:Ubiquitin-like protease family profile domain-containing protein n=1 Tax=Capsicum baccatum TaxID=33114 RepID=A0A2G2WBZ0_CAPBA|nr:hypothetical protein CQW23_16773 [Capsicum baccatum]